MAAHPQQEQPPADREGESAEPVKNPFPSQMTVPGPDGEPVIVDLAVVDGVVYAPGLDEVPVDPGVRQYVTQYCQAWTQSHLTTDTKLNPWPEPPRRAQIVLRESQLHAMLGLAGDERLLRVDVDQVNGYLRFIVESPRLPRQPYWDGGPPIINLPVAAFYEGGQPPVGYGTPPKVGADR